MEGLIHGGAYFRNFTVPPEAIKAAGEVSEEVLHDLCNRILDEERVPEKRKKGLLIKLPKYGDVSNCKNWCGIILFNIASKKKVFCTH